MKVILLRDVPSVGMKGDIKNVADGYANNFLLPKKLAVLATSGSIASMERNKATAEEEKRIADDLMAKTLIDLDGKKVVLKTKVNEAGHLFKGVHKKEVVVAIKSGLKLDIPEDYLILEQPLKTSGSHTIIVKSNTAKAEFELLIEAE